MGSRGWLVGCLVASWCAEAQAQLSSTYGVPLSEREREAQRAKEEASKVELEVGRLRGAELRIHVPDLQSQPDPPWLGASLACGFRLPFQLSVLQLGVFARPLPWLRVSLDYAAGFILNPDTGAHFTQYAEGLAGVRFWHAQRETAVDLPLATRFRQSKQFLRAWVPADHGLMVEAGVMTGGVALKRCNANCEPGLEMGAQGFESAPHQLVYPLFGLRYLYFHQASSRQLGIGNPFFLQIYLHAIARPVNEPTESLFFIDREKRAGKAPIGARIGAVLPRYNTSLGLGYTPYPAFLYFEALLVLNFSSQRPPR